MHPSGFVVLVFALSYAGADDICARNVGIEWKADADDCSVFYLCFNTKEYKYTCPVSYVRDFITKACVPKGSVEDTCTNKDEEPICLPDEVLKPHPTGNCAKYIDCEILQTRVSDVRSATKECEYPLLFDQATRRCETPETANCGVRFVPKDPCEYEANQCTHAHCIPCHIRFPSCSDLPDGMNAWKGREKSPYYVVCKLERVVYHGQCSTKDKVKLFSPRERVCVEQS